MGALEKTRIRLSALLSRRRIDRALAAGQDLRCSEAHALRARQLTAYATRRRLAQSLRQTVSDAELPYALRRHLAVQPLRSEVIACREALLGIADRLEWPGSLNACGVARVLSLITDGVGPLYCRRSERSLIEAIWWIADGLGQCPPTTNDRAVRPA